MRDLVTRVIQALAPWAGGRLVLAAPDEESPHWRVFNRGLVGVIEQSGAEFRYSVKNPRTDRVLAEGIAEQLEAALELAAKSLGDTHRWREELKKHLLRKAGLHTTSEA